MESSNSVEFRVLGPLEVVVGGRAMALGGAKPRLLLAALLTQANAVVSADRLIDILWGDRPPETAQNTLQKYVYRLREAIYVKGSGPGRGKQLLTRPPGYLLRVRAEQLDAARFEDLVSDAQRRAAQGELDAALALLDAALGLWRGPAWAEFADHEFARPEVARLEGLRAVAMEERAEIRLHTGFHNELVGELEAIAALNPLRERPRAQLMLALHRAGRQAEALRVYQDFRRYLVEEVGLEPSPELRRLEAAIIASEEELHGTGTRQDRAGLRLMAGRASAQTMLHDDFPPLRLNDASLTNLPAQTTTFVGRERHTAQVASALEAARVVTLTGVGGVGKTRLAVQAATHVLPRYRDGAWLVELAPTFDPAAVVEIASTALGVAQRQGKTLSASLLDFLRAKRLLLLLDNCEHLIEAAARFVDEVVRACPHLSVLATSREQLGVGGERIIAVPSLELPEESDADPETVRGTEAVRLFAHRAADAKIGFTLNANNQAAVAQLCRQLDGIPLAIELAAARVRSLTPAELAERLDERFRLLAGGPRAAVERHQTLRRAIDWSYELLTGAEQQALNCLAIFAGDFGLDAAEAVVGDAGIDVAEVVDLLGHLVDKSLISAEDHDGTTRYLLLETIRQYAQERLETAGDAQALRRRHAEHYVAVATEARRGLRGPDEVSWSARLEAELDNLRAARAWLLATGDAELALRLVAGLARIGTPIGYISRASTDAVLALPDAPRQALYPEVIAWAGWSAMVAGDAKGGIRLTHQALELAAAGSVDASSMCRVLTYTQGVAAMAGNGEETGRLAGQLLVLARSLGNDFDIIGGLTGSAISLLYAGDNDAALVPLDEAMAVARRLGNPSQLSHVAMLLGQCRLDAAPDRAQELFDEALEAAASVGNYLAMFFALASSAFLHLAMDDWREAARRLLHATERAYRFGDSSAIRWALFGIFPVLAMAGADEAAALCYGAAPTSGTTPAPSQKRFLEAVAALRQRIGEDRFDACVEQGAAMDDDKLVTLIRDALEPLLVEKNEGVTDAALS